MDRRTLKDILAAHADQLLGDPCSSDVSRLLQEPDDELAPLLSVAERVQSTLKPISPTHEFEQELKRQLLTTAHLRQVQGYEPPRPFRDLFVFLAAIAFFLSLAGFFVASQGRAQRT
ncbi:MAG: hypothetical protein Kow0031_00660 [Anaerolineae bacterium]